MRCSIRSCARISRDLIERALALSERRLQLQADGEAAAWRLESLRRAGRAVDAEQPPALAARDDAQPIR